MRLRNLQRAWGAQSFLPASVTMALESRALLLMGGLFGTGVLFQFLGCALWNNWWPMVRAAQSAPPASAVLHASCIVCWR